MFVLINTLTSFSQLQIFRKVREVCFLIKSGPVRNICVFIKENLCFFIGHLHFLTIKMDTCGLSTQFINHKCVYAEQNKSFKMKKKNKHIIRFIYFFLSVTSSIYLNGNIDSDIDNIDVHVTSSGMVTFFLLRHISNPAGKNKKKKES